MLKKGHIFILCAFALLGCGKEVPCDFPSLPEVEKSIDGEEIELSLESAKSGITEATVQSMKTSGFPVSMIRSDSHSGSWYLNALTASFVSGSTFRIDDHYWPAGGGFYDFYAVYPSRTIWKGGKNGTTPGGVSLYFGEDFYSGNNRQDIVAASRQSARAGSVTMSFQHICCCIDGIDFTFNGDLDPHISYRINDICIYAPYEMEYWFAPTGTAEWKPANGRYAYYHELYVSDSGFSGCEVTSDNAPVGADIDSFLVLPFPSDSAEEYEVWVYWDVLEDEEELASGCYGCGYVELSPGYKSVLTIELPAETYYGEISVYSAGYSNYENLGSYTK